MSVSDILNNFINAPANQPYPIHQYAFISPIDIPFTKEVRAACEANLCGRYGKSWACPPGAGDWEELRDHYKNYKNALVYTTKHDLEDPLILKAWTKAESSMKSWTKLFLACLKMKKSPSSFWEPEAALSAKNAHIPTRPAASPKKPSVPWKRAALTSSPSLKAAA